MKKSILENKIVLWLSCIPYFIILSISIYCGVVGFRWMDSWCVGFEGFISAIGLIGLVLVATPMGVPVFICVIYQVVYYIHYHKKQKKQER